MTESTRISSYRFGDFELQPGERRLLAHGESVALGPRAFDLLVALVERAGHLVTKETLLERVWPKLIVEENNLQVQISALRKILGQEAITTIPGRGYQFNLTLAGDNAARSAARTSLGDDPPQASLRPGMGLAPIDYREPSIACCRS